MSVKLLRGVWAVFVCTLFVTAGCAEKVEMRTVDMDGGATAEEKQKVRGYLDAASIKGEIVQIIKEDDAWLVDVGSEKPKEGQRARPMPPKSYRVDKKDGKVTGGGT